MHDDLPTNRASYTGSRLRAGVRAGLAIALVLAGLVGVDASLGWPAMYWVGIRLLYREAALPAGQVVRNLPYRSFDAAGSPRLRFDLYLPQGRGWPMVVFAHGGGWREGDKDLRIGGADVYANIGRFLAAHGVGTAIINYRLLPDVSWPQQLDDVAHAVVTARTELARRGARGSALFLMGHSAGAQLVTRVALDPGPLSRAGGTIRQICGVIPISGAGLDLTDQRTWDLGADFEYYRTRFAADGAANWQRAASPMRFVSPAAPPFLVIYSGGESKPLARQSSLLADRLRENDVPVYTVVVPGGSHERILLALSRNDQAAGPAILQFVKGLRCGIQ
jgi:arylformamidase